MGGLAPTSSSSDAVLLPSRRISNRGVIALVPSWYVLTQGRYTDCRAWRGRWCRSATPNSVCAIVGWPIVGVNRRVCNATYDPQRIVVPEKMSIPGITGWPGYSSGANPSATRAGQTGPSLQLTRCLDRLGAFRASMDTATPYRRSRTASAPTGAANARQIEQRQ